ncbi:glycosyltransferase [Rossellomorea marisflavi]|uniref:glycosyltransferase n=1 Tax=Rossellomorea marisflavi TaxID=189381 RepID=UPI003D2EAB32
MIFVTVGTHEQQFDRLIKEVDQLKINEVINEDVFIQSGFSNYVPIACTHKSLISYEEMIRYVKGSRIVITHGGPGSIMLPLAHGKTPIVVPRQRKYKEHVDDHQVLFTRKLGNEKKILNIENISGLKDIYSNYEKLTNFEKNDEGFKSNVDQVTLQLDHLIESWGF